MLSKIIFLLAIVCLGPVAFADSELKTEKAESQKFIDKEAKVAKTEQSLSGLLYRPIKAGKGDYPSASDTVTVEYKGTLRTGKVFDASPKGKPATFSLGGVIPCWTEGLKKMKPGGSAILICPSHIAYGDQGMGPDIKGGAALKFEVTLVKVTPF